MKCLVLFVVALAVGSQAQDSKPVDTLTEFLERFKVARDECATTSNADPKAVNKVNHGILEDDPKLREFLLCLLKKYHAFDETGEFNKVLGKEVLLQAFSEEIVNKILEKCAIKRSTPQETAYKYFDCALKYVPTKVFQKLNE